MKQPDLLVLDLGYGYTNGRCDTYIFKQQSVLGEPRPLFDDTLKPRDIRLEQDGEELFVGDLAVRQSKVLYYSTEDNKPQAWVTDKLFKSAIGYLAPSKQINLITGLPVDFYFTQRDSMVNLIEGVNNHRGYIVKVGKKSRIDVNTMIMNYKIVPQPFGALMNLLINDDGEYVTEYIGKNILVADFGFHTFDLLPWYGTEIGKEAKSVPGLGVKTAYELIKEYLKKELGRCPSDLYTLDSCVLKDDFEGYYLHDLTDKAFKTLARQGQNEIESINRRFDYYIITGGCAPWVAPHISLEKKIVFGQEGNLDGYYKIGVRTWGVRSS